MGRLLRRLDQGLAEAATFLLVVVGVLLLPLYILALGAAAIADLAERLIRCDTGNQQTDARAGHSPLRKP